MFRVINQEKKWSKEREGCKDCGAGEKREKVDRGEKGAG